MVMVSNIYLTPTRSMSLKQLCSWQPNISEEKNKSMQNNFQVTGCFQQKYHITALPPPAYPCFKNITITLQPVFSEWHCRKKLCCHGNHLTLIDSPGWQ